MSMLYIWKIYYLVCIAYQIYQIIFAFETSQDDCLVFVKLLPEDLSF